MGIWFHGEAGMVECMSRKEHSEQFKQPVWLNFTLTRTPAGPVLAIIWKCTVSQRESAVVRFPTKNEETNS